MNDAPTVEAFGAKLEELFGGYDRPLTDAKRRAYRLALAKMHELAFDRVVEHCLSPDGPDALPSTKQLWKLHFELRSRDRAASAPKEAPYQGDDWDRLANKHLAAHLVRQILKRGKSFHSPEDSARMRERGRVLKHEECSAETLERHQVYRDAAADWARLMRDAEKSGVEPTKEDMQDIWKSCMRSAAQKFSHVVARYETARSQA